MKTFEDMFGDVIDRTNGTVVLDEKTFKEIQGNVLRTAADIAHGCESFGGKSSKAIYDLSKTLE